MAKGQTSRVLVWILLGLLIVGLAGFGATNFGGSVRSVGKVGDTDIDLNGPVATANVTAAAPSGVVATQPLTFITGPSPTGWQLSKQSALALMSSVG